MTREEFNALVLRLEQTYQDRPRALQRRALLFVGLGYLGLLGWFVLVFLVGAVLYFTAIRLDTAPGILLLVVGGMMLLWAVVQTVSCLWIRFEQQPERLLDPMEAPALFERLRQLSDRLSAGRVVRVYVTAEYNASVRQVSRLGIFGRSRNELYIGLPLWNALTPPQFDAVLAHEMAHLSSRDAVFGASMYRLRQSWEKLFTAFDRPPASKLNLWGRKVLSKFIDWYSPRFGAQSLVLSRLHEIAADRFAASCADAEPAITALWTIDCHTRRLNAGFWQELWKEANTFATPPAGVLDRLFQYLATPPDQTQAANWIDQSLRTITDTLDTHPSLADRIRAMGGSPERLQKSEFPLTPTISAASVDLGEHLQAVQRDVEAHWQAKVKDAWGQAHARAASRQHQLASLNQGSATNSDASHLWDKLSAVYELQGPAAAVPLLEQFLTLRPDHAYANLLLGQHLLRQGQSSGEAYLWRVLELEDEPLVPQACDVLAGHYQGIGLPERVRDVHRRLSRFQAAMAAAQRERSCVTASDTFVEHGLRNEDLDKLRILLAQQESLSQAHVAAKKLEHFTRERLFVLCVRTARHWADWTKHDKDAALVSALLPLVKLPGRVLIITANGSFRGVAKKVVRVPGSLVYPELTTPA